MPASDESIEPQFFLAIFVAPTSEALKLEESGAERMLEVLEQSILRCFPHWKMGYSLGILTKAFDFKVPPTGRKIGTLTQRRNSEQVHAYHYLPCSKQWIARSWLCATTDAVWDYSLRFFGTNTVGVQLLGFPTKAFGFNKNLSAKQ